MRIGRLGPALSVAVCAFLLPFQALAQTLIRDAEIERTLDRMTAPILQAAGLSPSTVEIYILQDRDLNAFVAGGRNIFLNTGLIMKLDTPEELLGVIAHETGHIAGGHLARRAIAQRNAQGPAALGLLIGIAAGIAGGGEAGAAALGGSQALVARYFLKFTRAEEAAADQAALDYLRRARISPEGLLGVMELFRGQEVFTVGNVDPYVQTHPLSTARYELLERKVREITAADSFATDPQTAYWHGRMRAKLEGFLDRPERVLARYEDAPETEFSLYATAVAWHRMPNTTKALAAIDKLIAMHPDDAYYWELKGQILFESARGDEAVPPYRKAVALAPDAPLIAGGLGRALLALGDPAADREALKVLEEARRDDIGDAAVLRDLAVAYARAGDDGMAALATAERYALSNDIQSALIHARRAVSILKEGTPGWIRAQDILALDREGAGPDN